MTPLNSVPWITILAGITSDTPELGPLDHRPIWDYLRHDYLHFKVIYNVGEFGSNRTEINSALTRRRIL